MSDSVWPHRRQPPGSPVPGILQARTLEWVAISFFNAWKWKVKAKLLSCVRLLATPWTAAYQAPPSMGFSRQEYWSWVPLPSQMNASIWEQRNTCWPPLCFPPRRVWGTPNLSQATTIWQHPRLPMVSPQEKQQGLVRWPYPMLESRNVSKSCGAHL